MIQISHEFPLKYYANNLAEIYTDYDYCLVHRYIENNDYKDYFIRARDKGRTIILDNSLFEIGLSFSGDEYASVIKELRPTYYLLPDTFNNYEGNIKSQMEFYEKYNNLPSIPIAALHGVNAEEILNAFDHFDKWLPKEAVFALPFGSKAFERDNGISYLPLRMAINRQSFLKTFADKLSTRKFHLLGCKSLAEYDYMGNDFDKSFIISTDSSLPVAFTLQLNSKINTEGYYQDDDNSKTEIHYYKPSYLIDKHFYDEDFMDEHLSYNIGYFRLKVHNWYGN